MFPQLFLAKDSVVSNSSGEVKIPTGKTEMAFFAFYSVALVSSFCQPWATLCFILSSFPSEKNRMVK